VHWSKAGNIVLFFAPAESRRAERTNLMTTAVTIPEEICCHAAEARIDPPAPTAEGGSGRETLIAAILTAATLGITLARLDRRLIVHAFERDWPAVDRLREAVRLSDLADRVTVRVIDALSFVNLSDYDLVLAESEQCGAMFEAKACR